MLSVKESADQSRRIDEHRIAKSRGATSPNSKQQSPAKPTVASEDEPFIHAQTNPQSHTSANLSAPAQDPHPAAVQPKRAEVRLATHVSTKFTDPIEHATQTISGILANGTFPNKFRVKARVVSVHGRGIKGNDTYVQKHCGHCRRA